MISHLQYALEYAALEWRVIPLRPVGEKYSSKGEEKVSDGKIPKIAKWQRLATTDEEQIIKWWTKWPDAGIGVVMGPSSRVMDIECDSKEAEDQLQKFFESHDIVAPTFQSDKGKHRIFVFSESLPHNKRAHWTIMPPGVTKGGIDFKVGCGNLGTFSVFPPTLGESGKPRKWLQSLSHSEIDTPEFPLHVAARVVAYMEEGSLGPVGGKGRPKEMWDAIADGVPEHGGPFGGRDNTAFNFACKKAREIDISNEEERRKTLVGLLEWDQKNTPPLGPEIIEDKWKRALDVDSRRRLAERSEKLLRNSDTTSKESVADKKSDIRSFAKTLPGAISDNDINQMFTSAVDAEETRSLRELRESTDGPQPPPGAYNSGKPWGLTKVLGDPLYWELESPYWDGALRLTLDQLDLGRLVRREALSLNAELGPNFSVTWEGNPKKNTRGLRAHLLAPDRLKTREAKEHEKRWFVVMSILWQHHFRHAKPVEDFAKWATSNGCGGHPRPCILPSGDCIYIEEGIAIRDVYCTDYPSRKEIGEVIHSYGGGQEYRPRKGNTTSRLRAKMLPAKKFQELREAMGYSDGEQ